MEFKTNLAHRGNYGGSRSLTSIKYIVIHYTANDGDTDENNGIYFKNNDVDSSAHYFVDDDSITQSVPDNCIAWHCGAKAYKHPYCRNSNSIGIEICDDLKNGVIYPSEKTIANVVELTKILMQKYGIPKANVIRHFDVTGKHCPAYWVNNEKWKAEFLNKLDGAASGSTTTTTAKGGNTVNITMSVLKKGSTGKEVKTLQRLLIALGYSCGSSGADGSFGNATLEAVKKFQKAKGLVVDGSVGSATWNAILKNS
jgi:N-acetylmuramoyl-L-alanine amidase